MADPKRKAETPEDIHNLFERVRKLELKITSGLKPRGVTNLDQLADVELLYADELAKPTHGQQLWFDGERDSKFAGLWIAGGGPMQESTFTDSGFGAPVIDETLGGPDWDPTTPCLVTATLNVDTTGFGWGPEIVPGDPSFDITIAGSVDIDITGMGVTACSFPDPVSMTFPEEAGLGGYIAHPTGALQLYDPGDPYQVSAHQFDLLTTGNGSVAWLFPSGTPQIVASVVGASPYTADSPDLTLVVNLLPLAGRQPAP